MTAQRGKSLRLYARLPQRSFLHHKNQMLIHANSSISLHRQACKGLQKHMSMSNQADTSFTQTNYSAQIDQFKNVCKTASAKFLASSESDANTCKFFNFSSRAGLQRLAKTYEHEQPSRHIMISLRMYARLPQRSFLHHKNQMLIHANSSISLHRQACKGLQKHMSMSNQAGTSFTQTNYSAQIDHACHG